MAPFSLVVVLLVFCLAVNASYLAGVVHHVAIEGATPRDTLNANLAAYKLHAEAAGKRGVDIVVFPEFGLGGVFDSRDGLLPYCEDIPDMKEGQDVIPCYTGHPIEQAISVNASCWALQNNVTIALEYYDVKYCDRATDPNCPADGRYQYNTEVVFDRKGRMIAKYYKFHEWIPFRAAIDMPQEAPLVTFTTDFGVRFGIFMCFDIFFPSPAMDLVDMGVEHFIYSVAMNLRLGKNVHEAWSKKANAVLLSSNLGQRWSGIFDGGVEPEYEAIEIDGYRKDSLLVGVVARA